MNLKIQQSFEQLDDVILGKSQALRLALCCLLSRGHLLIEDVPGVGKTTLAHALAKTLGLQLQRIQFTSDLLPADIVGNSIFDQNTQEFRFHQGPIFAPMILADEVNRATPKTQSALLEAMEEGQVTVDGKTYLLPDPFFVIATQNPLHQVGTYPLPESQLDRFLMRVELGFPDRSAEREMLRGPNRRKMLKDLEPVLNEDDLRQLQAEAEAIHVSEPILEYILDLLAASRQSVRLGEGLSPRAGLALQRCAQSWALMEGREMVLPEDVQAVAPSVMAHRLGGMAEAETGGMSSAEQLVKSVEVR